MDNKDNMTVKSEKKRRILRYIGICMMLCGALVLAVFAYKKISRELYLRRLLRDNIILEIPSLDIRVPVLEGTDNKTMAAAAGHFEGKGKVGSGNFCIAGHNSTIYAEIFNDLDEIQMGDEIILFDIDEERTPYTYIASDYFIVDPSRTDVLTEYGDDRITIVTCTDDGKQRQIIVGTKLSDYELPTQLTADDIAKNADITYNGDHLANIDGDFLCKDINDEDDAFDAIGAVSELLGIRDMTAELRLLELASTKEYYCFLYQQYFKGVPVECCSVAVTVDKKTKHIVKLGSSFEPDLDMRVFPETSAKMLIESLEEESPDSSFSTPKLIIEKVGTAETPRLVWCVEVDGVPKKFNGDTGELLK